MLKPRPIKYLHATLVTSCCLLRSDHILCSVTFPTDERVAVQWLTREQNYVVVQIYDFDGSSWRETQVGIALRVRKKIMTVSVRSSDTP